MHFAQMSTSLYVTVPQLPPTNTNSTKQQMFCSMLKLVLFFFPEPFQSHKRLFDEFYWKLKTYLYNYIVENTTILHQFRINPFQNLLFGRNLFRCLNILGTSSSIAVFLCSTLGKFIVISMKQPSFNHLQRILQTIINSLR